QINCQMTLTDGRQLSRKITSQVLLQGMKRTAHNFSFKTIKLYVDDMDSRGKRIIEIIKLISVDTLHISPVQKGIRFNWATYRRTHGHLSDPFESLEIDRSFILQQCRIMKEIHIDFECCLLERRDLRELWKEIRSGSLSVSILSLTVALHAFNAFLLELT
ncbi:hypothetical protein PFISCL1PPCAC_19196, partial [Pristionchus fissidentatus]